MSNGREESRAKSVGRSRSRNRHPSELLARKQQLISAANHANGGHLDSDSQLELNESVESRLESLSEMLKNHQQQQQGENGIDLNGSPSSGKSIDDVYILLAKKEKDVLLAAELGKVLLEKNDELSKANERITEEYSQKLELLEQDKHKLRRELELQNGEYENRLIELQTDCNILKNQLEEQQQLAKQTEKEKSKLIDDLVQQNQRLTSELLEATKSEELLSSQLEQITERFQVRLSSRQDHVAQLETLKEEIQVVNQRKQDLERRLKLANTDKSNLSAALDEAGDKILLLENLINERDGKLSELLEEVGELRDSSSWLSNELESMICLNERLAQSENYQTELEVVGQTKRSQLIESLRQLRLKTRSRQKASERLMERRRIASNQLVRIKRSKRDSFSLFEEIDSSSSSSDTNNKQLEIRNDSPNSVQNDDELEMGLEIESKYSDQLNGEFALELFALLQRFQTSLQRRKDTFSNQRQQQQQQNQLYSPNSADDSGISADDLERANAIEQQMAQVNNPAAWRQLIGSIKSLIEEMPCSSCQLMIAERSEYEQLQRKHARLCEQMRKNNEELLALKAIQPELEAKLVAFEERCKILSDDLSNCDKPKEEIVKLAWKARDEAVGRKNAAEISLAKARIENMQISSQLMEVVQQKGELSQKLAQFEDDIHYMTQDSVKAKFTWEEYAEKLRRSKVYQPDSATNLNPLVQLLGFSVAPSKESSNGANSKASQQMDNQTQSLNLMRNLTSSRFNLRFWQRNSSEKATDKDIDNKLTNKNDD